MSAIQVNVVVSDPSAKSVEIVTKGPKGDKGDKGDAGGVSSVNGDTGVVVLNPDDLNDDASDHKFASASQLSQIATNQVHSESAHAPSNAEANPSIATTVEMQAGTLESLRSVSPALIKASVLQHAPNGSAGSTPFFNGVQIPSARVIRIVDALVSTSNYEHYTVPSGKIFIPIAGHLSRISGSAGNIQIKQKIGSDLLNFYTRYVSTYGQMEVTVPTYLLAGEKIVSDDVSSGSYFFDLYGLEFDASDTGNLALGRVLNPASGENTLFTASGKTIFSKGMPNFNPFTSANGPMGLVGASGTSVSVDLYRVVGGGAKSSADLIYSTTISANGFNSRNNISALLETGDTLILDATAGGGSSPTLFTIFGINYPDPS